ncbi:MAG: hypothetical protein ABW221_16840 [Vicinamibacteria bacterium]
MAVLHAAIMVVGAPGYRYFGAGERMARLDEQGAPGPALVTAGLTAVFALWALYAFSGAVWLRRLPLLRTGLVAIGAVYTLRGLAVLPEAYGLVAGRTPPVLPRQLVFSLVSLAIGLAYLVGTGRAWSTLGARKPA